MVLVIIALIVGGVLVGRELIQQAKIRSVASQFQQYVVAINAFKIKYNCTPGDCTNGAQLFPSLTPYAIGNGYVDCAWPYQGPVVWAELSLAGLIAGNYAGTFADPPLPLTAAGVVAPSSALNAKTLFWFCYPGPPGPPYSEHLDNANYLQLAWEGSGYGPGGFQGITGHDSWALDQKLDDGLPLTGRMVVMLKFTGCGPDGENRYFYGENDTGWSCSPAINMGASK